MKAVYAPIPNLAKAPVTLCLLHTSTCPVIDNSVDVLGVGHNAMENLESDLIVLRTLHLLHCRYESSLRICRHKPPVLAVFDRAILPWPASMSRRGCCALRGNLLMAVEHNLFQARPFIARQVMTLPLYSARNLSYRPEVCQC